MTKSFAIVPAAGQSRRMGRHKLLLPWKGSTVIEFVLAAWRASRATRVVVVARAADGRLVEACRSAGAEVVELEEDPPEMKVSVERGLAHVERRWAPASGDVWLLAPADMPRLAAATIDRLLAEHDASHPSILAPTCAGRRGHPVLFPWALASELAGLGGGQGARTLLQRHSVRLVPCDDPAILEDLDTPGDYERLSSS